MYINATKYLFKPTTIHYHSFVFTNLSIYCIASLCKLAMHFFNWNVGYPSSSTSSSYHVMSHDMSFVWYLASMKTSLSNMCLCVFVVLFFTFPDTATASNLVRARRANLTPTLPGISLAPRARQGNRSHFHFTCFLLAPMSR